MIATVFFLIFASLFVLTIAAQRAIEAYTSNVHDGEIIYEIWLDQETEAPDTQELKSTFEIQTCKPLAA